MKIKKQSIQYLLLVLSINFIYLPKVYSGQEELENLSVEDLLNIEVTSVAKKAKSLNDSPAAIFVITQDDIKRIGATSIPEALRLAPGIDVARIDANKWAVSARGFNGRFANKLLVLIDGRNTYTRSFAGVYWENQDVMLEDVDRIEVIRGPGATLWGANAVNGVINIISKHSADTQGGLVVAGGGTEEQGFGAFRYGGKLNKDSTGRVYIKGFTVDENTHEQGGDANDDWKKIQGGFRVDSQISTKDNLTLQGDVYSSRINQNQTFPQLGAPYQINFNEPIDNFGGNLLIRQQHTFSSTSDYSLQVFYDYYAHDEAFSHDSRHVVDIDFHHRFAVLDWNDVVWGGGYRYSHDEQEFSSIFNLNSSSRNDQLFSAFIQDEITLVADHLWLSIGSKFEYNDYSGFEAQPTARLMWAPHPQHRIWAAASRAVRTPSRAEHDMTLLQQVIPPFFSPPVAVTLNGNNQVDSEKVISYELGYRTTMIDNVSIDLTVFYNDYRNLRSVNRLPSTFNGSFVEQPFQFANNHSADTYGLEISTIWQMLDWWRWDINYSLLKTYDDNNGEGNGIGYSPQQRVILRSAMSPWENIDFDVFFRYVDSNKAVGTFGTNVIDAYVSMDVRLAWKPINGLELSLVGQNLLAKQHLEYQQESLTAPTEIERGMYGKMTWHF